MPVVTISMRRGRTPVQKQCVITAVCTALEEALEVENTNNCIRMFEFAPEDFYLCPSPNEGYLLIEIDCCPGRNQDRKDQFYHTLLTKLDVVGEDTGQVLVQIRENPVENWGYAGKQSLLPGGLNWYYHTKICRRRRSASDDEKE